MLPSIDRILYATDLSDNSTYAFGYVSRIAAMSNAEIHVLHIVEAMSDDAKLTLMMFVQDEATRRRALDTRLENAKETLGKRQDMFWNARTDEDKQIRNQIKSINVIEGFAAEEILKHADSTNADMIVLGAHEHGISHSFLGNTAKRVLRRAKVPTLIVPRQGE